MVLKTVIVKEMDFLYILGRGYWEGSKGSVWREQHHYGILF